MLDFGAFVETLQSAVAGALEESAEIVVAAAKAKAPVRKIFEADDTRTIRFKSASEVESDRDIRRALNLGPEIVAPKNTWVTPYEKSPFARVTTSPDRYNLPWNSRERRIIKTRDGGLRVSGWAGPGHPHKELSARGRWELLYGHTRAISSHYKGHLGGRLRGEIDKGEVEQEKERATIEVISPTAYAKYQEFGTRRHPAHPFLRPALHESGSEFASIVAEAVGKAAQRGIPSGGEPIVVRVPLVAVV